jgi:nicotinamidase-related amidase
VRSRAIRPDVSPGHGPQPPGTAHSPRWAWWWSRARSLSDPSDRRCRPKANLSARAARRSNTRSRAFADDLAWWVEAAKAQRQRKQPPYWTARQSNWRRQAANDGNSSIGIFYVPHRRYRPGDYETWTYLAPIQKAAWKRRTFESGTWGSEFRAEFEPKPGEIVVAEHWCSSGFANTDLDLQLKNHGIHQLMSSG